MEFEKYLVKTGVEDKIKMNKEFFYWKELPCRIELPVLVTEHQNETHFVKDASHNITVALEVKNEPGLIVEGLTSETENDTASVFSYSEKFNETMLETDETEVEIKEEPWWLETATEVKYDEDNSSYDAVEQNEMKVETSGFVRKEKNAEASPAMQQHMKSTTASLKKLKKQDADKKEHNIMHRILLLKSNLEYKDEWSVFGQFVTTKLRSLHSAPKLQIQLKNLIHKSIIEVTRECTKKTFECSTSRLCA